MVAQIKFRNIGSIRLPPSFMCVYYHGAYDATLHIFSLVHNLVGGTKGYSLKWSINGNLRDHVT